LITVHNPRLTDIQQSYFNNSNAHYNKTLEDKNLKQAHPMWTNCCSFYPNLHTRV